MNCDVPASYMQECFDYSVVSGRLYWRARPMSHFASDRDGRIFSTKYAGKRASAHENNGYLKVDVRYQGRLLRLMAHRVAWAVVTGEWPDETVDHANMVRSDNHWINLRAATFQQNMRNTKARPHNKTGLKWVKRTVGGKYQAYATVDRRARYFGTFDDAPSAHAAAVSEVAALYGEFLNVGSLPA